METVTKPAPAEKELTAEQAKEEREKREAARKEKEEAAKAEAEQEKADKEAEIAEATLAFVMDLKKLFKQAEELKALQETIEIQSIVPKLRDLSEYASTMVSKEAIAEAEEKEAEEGAKAKEGKKEDKDAKADPKAAKK